MASNFRRELIKSFIIIFGGLAVFGSGLYFLSKDVINRSSTIFKEKVIVAENAATLGSLANLHIDVSRANLYGQAMDAILVPEEQLLDFHRWLDGLARIRKVSLIFSFQGNKMPPQADFPGYISFSLDAGGPLQNLSDFLKDAEYQAPKYLISLDSIDLNNNISNGSDYHVLANGKVFFK